MNPFFFAFSYELMGTTVMGLSLGLSEGALRGSWQEASPASKAVLKILFLRWGEETT